MNMFVNISNVKDHPYTNAFNDFGITSSIFVTSYRSQILLWVGMAIIIPFTYSLNKAYRRKNKLKRLLVYCDNSLMWNAPAQSFFTLYLQMCILSFISIWNMQFSNVDQIKATTIALIFLGIVCMGPLLFVNVIMRNFDKIGSKEFLDRWSSLVEGQKVVPHKTINQMWLPLFFFRRFIYTCILVLFGSYPLYQILACVFTTMVMIAWLFTLRPFNTRLSNFLNIYNELTILVCFLTALGFRDMNLPQSRSTKYTYVMCAGLFLVIGLNMCIMLITLVIDYYRTAKRYY